MVEPPVSYLESTVPAAACPGAVLVRSTGCACMKSMIAAVLRLVSLSKVSGQCVQPLLLKFCDISLGHTVSTYLRKPSIRCQVVEP